MGQSCIHVEWCLGNTQGVQLSLPGHICCFPRAFQLLSLQCKLPFPCEVVLTQGRSRAPEPLLRGWVEKGFCRAHRGRSSPFAVTLLLQSHRALLSAQPGAVVQLQRLQQMERLPRRWRHCYKFPVPSELGATQGTSPSGLLLSPWKNLAFGAGVMLWVLQPGLEKGQYLQHKGPPEPVPPKCRQVL